ncbi:MAG: hypothetical protein ACREJX_05925, partial [Polyangiaceae bacterium]
TNVRPEDTRRGLATLLFAPRVDAGARVVREKSPKAAFDRHVAFVRKITEARRTAVRQNQDKSLYFEFRLARNRGIRRLGVVQIAIGVVAATIFFAVIAVTRHKSPALLLASPIFLLFCWLGGFLHAWIRRTKPLLAPRAKS